MNAAYLVDAGWMFFAAWSVVVFAVSVAAFGRDFFPQRKRAEAARDLRTPETATTRPNPR
jgi:hypothetical protein